MIVGIIDLIENEMETKTNITVLLIIEHKHESKSLMIN